MKASSHNKNDGQGVEKSTEEFKDRYYDKQEVLQLFHISSRTLQEWRDQNLITYFKVGQKTYYLKDSINKFIAERTIAAKTSSGSDVNIENEPIQVKDNYLLADSWASKTVESEQQKPVAKVWDPIPGYLLPILVILIYFMPFAPNILRGEQIDTFGFVFPLVLGILGGAPFILYHIGLTVFKKYISSKKLPKNPGK